MCSDSCNYDFSWNDCEVAASELQIPADFRDFPQFEGRFPLLDTQSSCVIDLETVRFSTCDRVEPGSAKVDTTSGTVGMFSVELIREPFFHSDTDLFIVKSHSPAAQVTLREFLAEQGIPIIGYIPRFAYLVVLDRSELSLIASQRKYPGSDCINPPGKCRHGSIMCSKKNQIVISTYSSFYSGRIFIRIRN